MSGASVGSPAEVAAVFAAQMAVFQALLLAASAAHKAIGWRVSSAVVERFGRVPRVLAGPALAAVVAAEAVGAVTLMIPAYRFVGGVVAAAIWALYLGLILRALASGRRDADCGCSFGGSARPLGAFQVARNATLLGLALAVIWAGAGRAADLQAQQFLGAFALLALYGALDQVMALAPVRRGVVL